jgi:hypothetical protein
MASGYCRALGIEGRWTTTLALADSVDHLVVVTGAAGASERRPRPRFARRAQSSGSWTATSRTPAGKPNPSSLKKIDGRRHHLVVA